MDGSITPRGGDDSMSLGEGAEGEEKKKEGRVDGGEEKGGRSRSR